VSSITNQGKSEQMLQALLEQVKKVITYMHTTWIQ
jgi:hypothetical protein